MKYFFFLSLLLNVVLFCICLQTPSVPRAVTVTDTVVRIDTLRIVHERRTFVPLTESSAAGRFYRDTYADSVSHVTIEDTIRNDSIIWRRVRADVYRVNEKIQSHTYTLTNADNSLLQRLGGINIPNRLRSAVPAPVWGYFAGIQYSPQLGIGIDGGIYYKRLYLGGYVIGVAEKHRLTWGVRAGFCF